MFWLLKLSSWTGSNKSAKRALLYIGNNVTNMLNTKQLFVNEMFWNTCTSFNTSYNSLVPAIFYLIFHIYMFCRFVAIGLIHSDKASLKTDSNLCEKHQINLIDGISCQKSLIRAFFFSSIFTHVPTDAKKTAFAIFTCEFFSLFYVRKYVIHILRTKTL